MSAHTPTHVLISPQRRDRIASMLESYGASDDAQYLLDAQQIQHPATDYDQLLAERDALLVVKANIERTEEFLRSERDALRATTAKLREALTTVRATIPHLGGAEKSTRWLCEIIDAALPTPSVTP